MRSDQCWIINITKTQKGKQNNQRPFVSREQSDTKKKKKTQMLKAKSEKRLKRKMGEWERCSDLER